MAFGAKIPESKLRWLSMERKHENKITSVRKGNSLK